MSGLDGDAYDRSQNNTTSSTVLESRDTANYPDDDSSPAIDTPVDTMIDTTGLEFSAIDGPIDVDLCSNNIAAFSNVESNASLVTPIDSLTPVVSGYNSAFEHDMDDVNSNLTHLDGESSSEIQSSSHCSNTLSNIDATDYSSSEKENPDSENSDINNDHADETSDSSSVDGNIQTQI